MRTSYPCGGGKLGVVGMAADAQFATFGAWDAYETRRSPKHFKL